MSGQGERLNECYKLVEAATAGVENRSQLAQMNADRATQTADPFSVSLRVRRPANSLMTKILLTGGAGFIGSHLAERLLTSGHEVTIVDELNDFYSPEIKRRNLAEIRARGAFDFVQADIGDLPRLKDLFERQRPETLIHLAARAGVRPSLEQPLLYERTNILGTLNLLELARQFAVSKFIFRVLELRLWLHESATVFRGRG